MTFTSLISLSIALIIIAATPGPGVIMTVTRSLQSGFRAGFWIVIGIVFMDLVVLIITLSGLSLLAHFSQPGLVFLKWFGAGFLIWLAWQNWQRPPITAEPLSHPPQRDFITGIIVSLTNPVLFYLAFLPAFIDLNQLSLLDSLGLILLISAILCLVLLAYALAAAKLQPLLFGEPQRGQIWLNRLSAAVLLLLAMSLIASDT
ncbi:MAG: LysE family translocator [Thiomicrospira sp.]|jgi:threonine/homoserine/homoserine lactone efflux protein|nr:LysE family translocator [Thiomicrospira sp.]